MFRPWASEAPMGSTADPRYPTGDEAAEWDNEIPTSPTGSSTTEWDSEDEDCPTGYGRAEWDSNHHFPTQPCDNRWDDYIGSPTRDLNEEWDDPMDVDWTATEGYLCGHIQQEDPSPMDVDPPFPPASHFFARPWCDQSPMVFRSWN